MIGLTVTAPDYPARVRINDARTVHAADDNWGDAGAAAILCGARARSDNPTLTAAPRDAAITCGFCVRKLLAVIGAKWPVTDEV